MFAFGGGTIRFVLFLLFPFSSFAIPSAIIPKLASLLPCTTMATPTQKCAQCSKAAANLNGGSFSRCAKCRETLYCNRDCQKTHWKTHKKVCASQANANISSSTSAEARTYVEANAIHSSTYSAPRLHDLDVHVPNPFTRLDQGTYLHGRSETDVYKLLIDSFRMRQADDLNLENKKTPESIYTGAASSIVPFRAYPTKEGTRRDLLPPWWNAEKLKECESFGENGAWSNLRLPVSKQQMIDHYRDERAPMQVRMLAEAVYGAGSMGQSGAAMRMAMVAMENRGPGGGQVMSMMNINNITGRS